MQSLTPLIHPACCGRCQRVNSGEWASLIDRPCQPSLPQVQNAKFDPVDPSRALTIAIAAGGAEARRAFEAMMDMKKIDIAKIDAARRG